MQIRFFHAIAIFTCKLRVIAAFSVMRAILPRKGILIVLFSLVARLDR